MSTNLIDKFNKDYTDEDIEKEYNEFVINHMSGRKYCNILQFNIEINDDVYYYLQINCLPVHKQVAARISREYNNRQVNYNNNKYYLDEKERDHISFII